VRVRQIVLAAPAPDPATQARPPEREATPAPRAAPKPPRNVLPAITATTAAPAVTAAPATPEREAGGEPVPVYATRLPPAATLQYSVQRETAARPGTFQAELRWRPAEGRYTLTLGLAATGWASVGELDAHGVAPERQVETRRGREFRAVNFQRDSARITFSGPQVQFALPPGAQDRISWLLQLPAVLAANPGLAEPGRDVKLFVAGARGDASLWVFGVVARENVELPAGAVVDALHLHREPGHAYDTRVDVWLDPARHHLPVRVRLQTRAEGETTEFMLTTLTEN
jgi:hypothetical protein